MKEKCRKGWLIKYSIFIATGSEIRWIPFISSGHLNLEIVHVLKKLRDADLGLIIGTGGRPIKGATENSHRFGDKFCKKS
jgi:hypothetical protein